MGPNIITTSTPIKSTLNIKFEQTTHFTIKYDRLAIPMIHKIKIDDKKLLKNHQVNFDEYKNTIKVNCKSLEVEFYKKIVNVYKYSSTIEDGIKFYIIDDNLKKEYIVYDQIAIPDFTVPFIAFNTYCFILAYVYNLIIKKVVEENH